MKIQIIGPKKNLYELINLNERKDIPSKHDLNFIALSGQEYILKKPKQNLSEIYVLDFHSITVEFTEFEPDYTIIIPFIYSESDLDEFGYEEEFLNPLTTEFLTHFSESNQIVRSKLVLTTFETQNKEFRKNINEMSDIVKTNNLAQELFIHDFPKDLFEYIKSI